MTIELRVSDVKQWYYCPRVVYWTRTAVIERPVTRKMAYGHDTHDSLDTLERRRTYQKYGLSTAKRHFHLRLQSEALGLTGMLDLCLETADALFPVEFKDTLGGVRQNHLAQLAAYAILLEDRYGVPVTRGFWVCIPRGQVKMVPISEQLKTKVRKSLVEMRLSIETEILPAPADRWEKCRDCEFLRFCGDRYR